MLIMVAVYTANLAALFSTNVQEKPIKSIGDLIESENTFFAFKDATLLLPQLNNPMIDHLLDEGRIEFPFEVNWGKKKQMVKEIEERLQKGAIWIAVDATIDFSCGMIGSGLIESNASLPSLDIPGILTG